MQNILDCETYLMEQMDFNLTIFHPYKPLQLYIETLKLEHETEFVQTAWTFVNDSYYCDAPLLYPPFMIAIAALYMSHQFHCRRNDTEEKIRIFRERDEKLRQWLDGLNIHMRQIGAITNLILDMYKILKDMKTGDLIAVPLFKITKLRNNNGWNIPQYPPPVQHQRPNNQMPPQMYMPNNGPPVQQQYQQRF
jgi:cyclin C